MVFRFLIVPIMVLVNAFVIPRWVREKVVNGVDITISFIGLLFVLVGGVVWQVPATNHVCLL